MNQPPSLLRLGSCCAALVAAGVLCSLHPRAMAQPAAASSARAQTQDGAADVPRRKGRAPGRHGEDLPELPPTAQGLARLSVVLGRPTDRSIVANVLSQEALQACIEYRESDRGSWRRTPPVSMTGGEPAEILIDGLQAGRHYAYRLLTRAGATSQFSAGEAHGFVTQRPPGQGFVFELQGDSHPERPHQFAADLYAHTLQDAARDQPDFYITMGDDFSVDTLHELNAGSVAARYRFQRPLLAIVGQGAPLFMVNGNHEQAAQANLDGSPDNVAVWAQTTRNRLFSLPAPDAFYSGDAAPVPNIGLLRDYYAWTWGDALFVVIDPYWHSKEAVDNPLGGRDKGRRDLWNVTLGEAQYRWLSDTLLNSHARFKFVFAHHVLGTGRGGVEMADQFEWGGHDRQGDDQFGQHRPGWALPIHALMVKAGVTIFFQGHDHVYAHQQLDGITYQTAPQPADPDATLNFEGAYRSGVVLPNSGRLRVSVEPARVRVEYIRSWPDATAPAHQGEPPVAYDVDFVRR